MKNSSRSPQPVALFGILLLLALFSGGCENLNGGKKTSRAAALANVHKIYQEEFVAIGLPRPSEQPSASARGQSFQRTISAINEFRTTHGKESVEAAHLTVLEGMAYLQSGQIGRARLMLEEVRQAAPKLRSGGGRHTRDELLARSFEPLVTGWEQIRNAAPGSEVNPSSAKFKQAADGIEATLSGLDAGRLAAPEVDAGAKYLATTSAIFRVWYGSLQPRQEAAAYQQGAALIGRYLTAEEKQAAESGNVAQLSLADQRFAAWYRFLRKGPAGS